MEGGERRAGGSPDDLAGMDACRSLTTASPCSRLHASPAPSGRFVAGVRGAGHVPRRPQPDRGRQHHDLHRRRPGRFRPLHLAGHRVSGGGHRGLSRRGTAQRHLWSPGVPHRRHRDLHRWFGAGGHQRIHEPGHRLPPGAGRRWGHRHDLQLRFHRRPVSPRRPGQVPRRPGRAVRGGDRGGTGHGRFCRRMALLALGLSLHRPGRGAGAGADGMDVSAINFARPAGGFGLSRHGGVGVGGRAGGGGAVVRRRAVFLEFPPEHWIAGPSGWRWRDSSSCNRVPVRGRR